MWQPGIWELLIILAIVLLLFGGSKISGLGRSLGTAISEFKDAVQGQSEEEPPPAENGEQHTGE